MAKLKTGDFVAIEYTGKINDTEQVFDTTREDVAKKEKIHNPKMSYNPVTICIGQNQVLPGIDTALIGKEEGKEFKLELKAENAFGKKSGKLLKLVPSNIFKKQGIRPFIGLEVQIDNTPGIIRTISGGRILVDFNHPLAGKNLNYEINIGKMVYDDKEKIKSYMELTLGVKDPKVTIKEGKAVIEMGIPKDINTMLVGKIKELIPKIKTIEFVSKKVQDKKVKDKNQ